MTERFYVGVIRQFNPTHFADASKQGVQPLTTLSHSNSLAEGFLDSSYIFSGVLKASRAFCIV